MEIFWQLLLATVLGASIGLERERKRKGAGLQTYSLICLGSAVFTILSKILPGFFGKGYGLVFDSSRIIQAIALGVGFIGVGVIFRDKSGVRGLTTAAGLWITAAIGLAVGSGNYLIAIVATFLVLFILIGFGELESRVLDKKFEKRLKEKNL